MPQRPIPPQIRQLLNLGKYGNSAEGILLPETEMRQLEEFSDMVRAENMRLRRGTTAQSPTKGGRSSPSKSSPKSKSSPSKSRSRIEDADMPILDLKELQSSPSGRTQRESRVGDGYFSMSSSSPSSPSHRASPTSPTSPSSPYSQQGLYRQHFVKDLSKMQSKRKKNAESPDKLKHAGSASNNKSKLTENTSYETDNGNDTDDYYADSRRSAARRKERQL